MFNPLFIALLHRHPDCHEFNRVADFHVILNILTVLPEPICNLASLNLLLFLLSEKDALSPYGLSYL